MTFKPYPKVFKEKKQPSGLKKKFREPTGEALVFAAIWKIRKHYCNNCKAWLGNEAKAHFFAHDTPKSRGEQFRLDPNNILLLCQSCHYAKDFQGEEKFNARKK